MQNGELRKKTTFQKNTLQCVAYVTQKFGETVVIVFHGHLQNQQQKTMHTNPKHNLHCAGPEHQVTATIKFAIKKNAFLSNTRNKQDIINFQTL